MNAQQETIRWNTALREAGIDIRIYNAMLNADPSIKELGKNIPLLLDVLCTKIHMDDTYLDRYLKMRNFGKKSIDMFIKWLNTDGYVKNITPPNLNARISAAKDLLRAYGFEVSEKSLPKSLDNRNTTSSQIKPNMGVCSIEDIDECITVGDLITLIRHLPDNCPVCLASSDNSGMPQPCTGVYFDIYDMSSHKDSAEDYPLLLTYMD